MRVLITGGRDYGGNVNDLTERNLQERDLILHVISQLPPGTIVREGGARGADTVARFAAVDRGDLVSETHHADWRTYGKAAGVIRNQEMLENGPVNLVIAFAGGTGTADMVRRALKADIPVWEPDYDERELVDFIGLSESLRNTLPK
jgi:hypothetical protein